MSLTSALEPNSSNRNKVLEKATSKNKNNKTGKSKSINGNSSTQNANQLNMNGKSEKKSTSRSQNDEGGTAALVNGKAAIANGHSAHSNGVVSKASAAAVNGKAAPVSASLEEQFKAACDAINNLPKNGPVQPSNEMLLKFYGYYKQATQGPCQSSRPSMFKVIERAKYDAWHSVRNLSKEEAMKGYIDEIKSILEIMPHNEHVQKFIDIIGPFYEYVNDENEPPMPSKQDLEMADDGDEHETESEDASTLVAAAAAGAGLEMSSVVNNSMISSNGFDKINPSMLNSYTSMNGSYSESIYLIGQNGTNGSMNGSSHHELVAPVQESKKEFSRQVSSNGSLNGGTGLKTMNGNGHAVINGASNMNDDDEDDEDYCDTSDILNDQDLLVATTKLNSLELNSLIRPKPIRQPMPLVNSHNGFVATGKGDPADYDLNHNLVPNALKAFNNDHSNGPVFSFNRGLNGASSNGYENGYRNSISRNDAELEAILNKLGGELMNSPPAIGGGGGGGGMARNSRPSSTQSVVYGGRNLPSGSGFNQSGSSGSAGGSGGGNGGGNPSMELLHHDTNRQILLILIKLQQDTNNVLRRLSYLESTVVTIQNNLQMNRLETNFDMNNQSSSAFSILANNTGRVDNYASPNQMAASNHRRASLWRNFFRNIDWRTVSIAIIWPFIIRLVFMFFRKVRLVIKLRRVRP